MRAAVTLLGGHGPVLAADPDVAAALSGHGVEVATPDGAPPLAVALLADEPSHAAAGADELLADLARRLRPGTLLVVSALSAVAAGDAGARGFRSDELERVLGHHGFVTEVLCAPGAAGRVRGNPGAPFDPDADRLPGLLDAAPRLLAVGRLAGTAGDRSASFFATLPRKVVAAGVLCRDADGRLLVVHDTYRDHWTIPGGVVDPDEDPRSAAEREAWEEAGMRVRAGAVLGVFSAPWPDRVVLVYGAELDGTARHPGTPAHAHEIGAVAWVPLDEALQRLAPHVAEQVRCCLRRPGGTWRQTLA